MKFLVRNKKYGRVLAIVAIARVVFQHAAGELRSFLHQRGAAVAGIESSSSHVALAHLVIHLCVAAPAQFTAAVNNGTSLPCIVAMDIDGATVCPAYGESPAANGGESVC